MKIMTIGLVLSLFLTTLTVAQQNSTLPLDTVRKMAVRERMVKARAAKAEKKSGQLTPMTNNPSSTVQASSYRKPVTDPAANHQSPVVKTPKGPNGEVVHTGERGALYYINKNGNKTYLSSNQ